MNPPKITVAIPTYNRPDYLHQSLKSVLDQTYQDFKVLILDNHSENDNKIIIDRFNDPRIAFIRHPENIGIIANWNKAIELSNTKYLSIFHDDDLMAPEFLAESILHLEENPNVAFSYCKANKVNESGKYISPWSELNPQEGIIKAPGYLLYTAQNGCCVTIAPTVVFRRDIFDKVGLFSGNLVFNSFDFNMYLRIALAYDIFFINEAMVNYRIHKKQMSQAYWWTDEKIKGRTATMLEIQNALWALVDKNPKILKDKEIATLIADAGIHSTKQLTTYIKKILPDI